MKLESKSDAEEIKLNMTAMIDIVFQLLVFFIMTFKIVAMEGDFNVKMPLTSSEPLEDILEDLPNTIKVRLLADGNGEISTISASDDEDAVGQTYAAKLANVAEAGKKPKLVETEAFQKLQEYVESRMAGGTDPTSGQETQLEFDIQYGLKYAWSVQALDKVSGRVQTDGTVKKLIEQIRFKDNSQNQ